MTTERSKVAFLVLHILIFAYASRSVAATDFRMIDTARLHSMVVDNAYRLEGGRERQFTVIDARSKEEYDEAHIFGAISVPEKDFEKYAALLPKDKDLPLVVYCNGMKPPVCKKWADKAAAEGYTDITIYSEGFTVWKDSRMPIAPFTKAFNNQDANR